MNKFPSNYDRFKDTRGAGSITLEGFELEADKDGFIEAPSKYEEQLFAHGFLKVGSRAYWEWDQAEQKRKAKPAEKAG